MGKTKHALKLSDMAFSTFKQLKLHNHLCEGAIDGLIVLSLV